MVYRAFSALLTFFFGESHFNGRLICEILAKIMKISTGFWEIIRADIRLLNPQSTTYVCRSHVGNYPRITVYRVTDK